MSLAKLDIWNIILFLRIEKRVLLYFQLLRYFFPLIGTLSSCSLFVKYILCIAFSFLWLFSLSKTNALPTPFTPSLFLSSPYTFASSLLHVFHSRFPSFTRPFNFLKRYRLCCHFHFYRTRSAKNTNKPLRKKKFDPWMN